MKKLLERLWFVKINHFPCRFCFRKCSLNEKFVQCVCCVFFFFSFCFQFAKWIKSKLIVFGNWKQIDWNLFRANESQRKKFLCVSKNEILLKQRYSDDEQHVDCHCIIIGILLFDLFSNKQHWWISSRRIKWIDSLEILFSCRYVILWIVLHLMGMKLLIDIWNWFHLKCECLRILVWVKNEMEWLNWMEILIQLKIWKICFFFSHYFFSHHFILEKQKLVDCLPFKPKPMHQNQSF